MQKYLLLILAVSGFLHLRAADHPIGSLSGTYQVGNSQIYKKLTDVANILNHTGYTVVGNVVFELDSDYDGTTGETFPITFNQFNSTGNWTVTIRPKAGVTLRTTAGNPGLLPLITLSGTDRIIFDGRAGGTGGIAWLIRNTAATNANATILLQNDAQNNLLTYLQLEGQTTSVGVLHIGESGAAGNDNNTISYCTIRDRSDVTGIPATGILSLGSEATSGTHIHDNNLFNIYNSNGAGYGIRLAQGTTAASVVHNSIYQTRTLTNGSVQAIFYGIHVAEWVAKQVVLNDNFIGGSAPECGGAPLTVAGTGEHFFGVTAIFFGMLNADGQENVCHNNTIRNMAITAENSFSAVDPVFEGIRVVGSRVDVTNNTIGNTDGHDDIKIMVNGGDYFITQMISFTSSVGGSVTGNKIGGITIGGNMAPDYPNNFFAISARYEGFNADHSFAVNNNLIGSTSLPDNIRCISPALPLSFYGIAGFSGNYMTSRCAGNTIAGVSLGYTGATAIPLIRGMEWDMSRVVIDSNLISDISSAAVAPSSPPIPAMDEPNFAFHGIYCLMSRYAISNNTVRRLRLTGTTPVNAAAGQNTGICGIETIYGSAARINNNKVYDLTSANNLGSAAATVIAGIGVNSGYIEGVEIYNNLVALDNGGHTNDCAIRAIRITTFADNPIDTLYHNTVYVGGNNGVSSNKAISYLVSRSRNYMYAVGTPSFLMRNNLFINGRTGGSGKHYIFHNTIPDFAVNWTTAASDTNVLVTADVNSIGKWGTSDLDSTQWKTTGGDAHSWFYTTSQIAPAGLFIDLATGNLEIKADKRSYVTGKGTASTGIATDYAGKTRSTTAPTIGAYEYAAVSVNIPPVITSHGGNAAVTLPIPENTTVVTTVTATDADAVTLVYSLAEGEDVSKFTINPSTGVLSFITAPDYEQPGDANGDNAYIVAVQVSDGDSTAIQRFKIKITDVNDHAPVITSYNGDVGVTLQAPENTTTVIATVTATDVDKNTTITYSLVNEEDAAQFWVNSSTGELSFVTPPPDFEHPTDANGDNMYIVTIKASDGDSSATQRFKIKVTNVNDNTPVITSHNGDALVSLQLPENTIQVSTVTATDADNTPVTYSILSQKDGSLFTVNPSTGELSFITAPDFEHPADANGDNIYLVSVQASDGDLSAVQRFSIKITDQDDNPPVATMTIRIPENTVEVTPLEGSDADAGTSVIFTLVDKEDGALFWINPANGTLEFKTAPDFEQPADADHDNVYLVSVKMTAGEAITILRFQVNVTAAIADAGRMTSRSTPEPAVQATVVLQMEAVKEPGKAVKAYPNPVTGKRFTLRMDSIATGSYTLELYTLAGQLVCRQQLNHTGKSVLYPVQLPGHLAGGMYLLKVRGAGLQYIEKLRIE